jgi:sporulation protein YqfC
MAGRRNLRQRFASMLELPGDALLDAARVSMVGDRELVVENHRGLLEYKEERLMLAVPEGKLLVCGTGLGIASIAPDQIVITGKMRSVEYCD